jgi:hypothetical protein
LTQSEKQAIIGFLINCEPQPRSINTTPLVRRPATRSPGMVAMPISIYPDYSLVDPLPPVEGEAPPDSGAVDDPQQPSEMFEGLLVFRLSLTDGLDEMGRISTQFGEYTYSSYTRGVFVGDRVYAVTDNGIRGADVSDPSNVRYELALPRPEQFFGDPIPVDLVIVPEPGIAE